MQLVGHIYEKRCGFRIFFRICRILHHRGLVVVANLLYKFFLAVYNVNTGCSDCINTAAGDVVDGFCAVLN